MFKLLLILSIVIALLSACTSYQKPIIQGNLISISDVNKLQVGLNPMQVAKILGPQFLRSPKHFGKGVKNNVDYVFDTNSLELAKKYVKSLRLTYDGNGRLQRWVVNKNRKLK